MYLRYYHVRNLAILVGSVGTLGSCGYVCCGGSGTQVAAPTQEWKATDTVLGRPTPVPISTPKRKASSELVTADSEMSTLMIVLALTKPPQNKIKKAKDLMGAGSKHKVNAYDDDQDGSWDRAKIDWNRDDVWDGKWKLKNNQWIDASGKPVLAGTKLKKTAKTVSKAPFADIAELMLNKKATSKKIKDYYGSGRPKVNIYDDDKNGTWDRAKIDVDRDGEPEEKWTVKNGRLERKIQASGKVELWVDGTWKPKG